MDSSIKINSSLYKVLILLLVILSCQSEQLLAQYSMGLHSTVLKWIVNYSVFFMMIYDYLYCGIYKSKDYKWCRIFFIWVIISVIRGVFEVDCYWTCKQLINGILMCSLPLIAIFFRDPLFVSSALRDLNRWMFFLYVFVFVWILPFKYPFFLLPFIVFYIAFFELLPTKWRLVVLYFFIIAFLGLDDRSFLVKIGISFLALCAVHFRNHISDGFVKTIHFIIYLFSIILLTLGLLGSFNVLQDLSKKGMENVSIKKLDNSGSIATDTRSFIYEDVFGAALDSGYVVWGNTPARGNYSYFFFLRGNDDAYENLNGKYERFANELVHLNIFTWLGIIGLILYSMIYFSASYLAVYKSNSFYIKMVGLMIAFHWGYGWIEDVNTFTIQNFWLWMMLAMGLSPQFRRMSDKNYEEWFLSIFCTKRS